MSRRNIIRAAVLASAIVWVIAGGGAAARAAEKTAQQNHVRHRGYSAPTMFAIERNYGPIEERSQRIPAELLSGGLAAPIAPVQWGFSYGVTRPWYGYYYGPRFNYGYGGPYLSYYRPYYGYRPYYYGYQPYGYGPYAGYGPYSTYRPWSYGAYYYRAPIVYGGYGGCYYW